MSLSEKEKGLAGVGISVAAGCKPCTNYHVKATRKSGASDKEIRRAVEIAVAIRHRAADIMAAHALGQLGEAAAEPGAEMTAPSRIDRLVAIGSAFAVNCPATLKAHLAAGGKFGLTQGEAEEIARQATFIRGKAIFHVGKLIPLGGDARQSSQCEYEQKNAPPAPRKAAGGRGCC